MFSLFESAGGEFLVSHAEFRRRVAGIRAFLFDWDGVFNEGQKGEGIHSGFTEADAMGLNLLRFGYWLKQDSQLPHCGILSGMNNPHAAHFAQREKLHSLWMGFINKGEAFSRFLEKTGFAAEEVAFVFDDVLDLPVAARCGLRICVRRSAGALFPVFVRQHSLADYVTAHSGGQHAVREVAELVLGGMGMFEAAVKERVEFSKGYKRYLSERNGVVTEVESGK